ncbi:MAG TPA: extracellular solute-binding protein, partial [Limnochordia bacterium]
GPPKGISASTGFVEGRIGMDWIGAWKMDSYMTARRSGGMSFAWGIAPVPLVENRANTRWNNPLYISAETPHPEAAWAFVKYATSRAGQSLWAEITGKIPARRSALPAYLNRVVAASGMSPEDLQTSVSGALAHSRRSLEESIGEVHLLITRERGRFIDAMLAGKQPIGSALQAFEELVNAYLRGEQ